MDGRTLPVRRFKDQILEKVQGNPVTLIYGETGSGKSSQVPQILEEGGLGPILCTQPRRLAVVAVSQRVAQERQTTLGEDVGYHIGQKNLSTSKSRIVFATAGILLEELRANGEKVFSRYRVIVLDEVHERSIESDLVLACAKQLLLRSVNARLVLMSATADFQRYSTYFSELGQGEKVQRIAIADPNVFLRKQLFDTRVKYIEQAVGELGQQRSHIEVVENFNRKEASPSPLSNAKIDQESHKLVRDLVLYIHSSETDLSKSILIFLPTYRCLENQWTLLQGCRQRLQIFVLHSSIDMNLCLKAMVAQESRYRKVVLATNIAESSVTMPGVSFVVDLCRNLELCWLTTENRHMPRIVWVSQSQVGHKEGRC